jgi:hypothetical protein
MWAFTQVAYFGNIMINSFKSSPVITAFLVKMLQLYKFSFLLKNMIKRLNHNL